MNAGTVSTAPMGRRLDVRYVCDVITRCAEPDSIPVHASVLDVSRTGIRLLTSRSFEPGSILAIDLSVAGGIVFACVLHAAAAPDGWWKIGCSFTATVSEERLRSLWKTVPDRRTRKRVPAELPAIYQADHFRGMGTVTDVSTRGLCLLVDRPLNVGTTLRLCLGGDGAASLSACVARVSQQGPKQWACGCSFIHELTDLQMMHLVEANE